MLHGTTDVIEKMAINMKYAIRVICAPAQSSLVRRDDKLLPANATGLRHATTHLSGDLFSVTVSAGVLAGQTVSETLVGTPITQPAWTAATRARQEKDLEITMRAMRKSCRIIRRPKSAKMHSR